MPIKSQINEEPASSFTSMIDIVFLLLIFFILQPFKEPENRLGADLPQDGSGPASSLEPPIKPIQIQIEFNRRNPDAAVFRIGDETRRVNGGPTAFRHIAKHLKDLSGGNLETPVAIMPHGDVHFEHVLSALDACYEAKMPKVKFGDEAEEKYRLKH